VKPKATEIQKALVVIIEISFNRLVSGQSRITMAAFPSADLDHHDGLGLDRKCSAKAPPTEFIVNTSRAAATRGLRQQKLNRTRALPWAIPHGLKLCI
jgi:hypothetical protein